MGREGRPAPPALLPADGEGSQDAGEPAQRLADLLSGARSDRGDLVSWPNRVRDAFAERGRVPDGDIVEELSQHAAAAFETARADGLSAEAADRQVQSLIDAWVAETALLRRRPGGAVTIE